MVRMADTVVSITEKADSETSTTVAAFEKMVAHLKTIFSKPKTMVRTSPTMVKIDRYWKIIIFNGLMVV
jgi:hypothetical protein